MSQRINERTKMNVRKEIQIGKLLMIWILKPMRKKKSIIKQDNILQNGHYILLKPGMEMH